MYAKLVLKLLMFYVIITEAFTATLSLCITTREGLNSNFQHQYEDIITSNRLLLRDCPSYPFIDNAVDHIRAFIVGKLKLPHLEWHILQASYTDKGLLFEMSTEHETKEVLDSFSVKLKNKECVLKPTFKKFITWESGS